MTARIAVAKDKFARGFDGSGTEVPDAYEILELRDALERTYNTDAHLVSYVVAGATRQPRLNKTGLPYFTGAVETTAFFCDIDNAAHAPWTDDLVAHAMREYESLPALATCGVYHTAHGRRIVQPIAAPIAVAHVEPYLRRWLLELEAAGLVVDWACRDWTRHFRLPNVRRNGRTYRSPLLRLDRMRPIELDVIADPPTPAEAAPAGRRTPRIATQLAWSRELPEHWEGRAVTIAKAVRDTVSQRWHDMYLALGGALLTRGLPPEHLPRLIQWIASAAGSEKPWSHESGARDTARRFVNRLNVTGYRTLKQEWRTVADALDEATATRTEARLREQTKEAPAAPPLAESMLALEKAIRSAPDGLTVISAECGIGKTRAAIHVAAERAAKPYASPDAKGARAPSQSKTSISVDKNELAKQIAQDLRALRTPVRRVFGPLSVLREDGTPECRYHDVARPLVAGGQPMQWELCQGRGLERCEFYEQCKARDGVEGPSDARVTVGPHALLAELDGCAGSTGLLVIDEPPALLETVVLTRDDLATAERSLGAFEGDFAAGIAPALAAFTHWLDLAEADKVSTPTDALRDAAPALPESALRAARVKRSMDAAADVTACAAGAISAERRSQAPPIQRASLFAAKRSVSYAEQVGTASKVLGTIRRALASTTPVTVRAEERGEMPALVFTAAREDLTNAVRRQGSVVVTDANADLHLPVLAKVVGYEPPFHRFAAAGGAPIQRVLLRCRSATRRGWFAHGRPVLEAGIATALRTTIDWLREDASCRTLGFISLRPLRLLIEAAQRPLDASVDEQWRELGQPKVALVEARATLGPILALWPGEILFGHYGAVRGLNSMADVDALVTFGDPWPNLGEVRNDVAFLGIQQAWEPRLEAMCRAELEQAHGRLRAVHRTRPGRALHVGNVLPSGYGWTSGEVEIRSLAGGPSAPAANMAITEFQTLVERAGGTRAAARTLGCSPMSVSRYCAGQRSIPYAVALALGTHNQPEQ